MELDDLKPQFAKALANGAKTPLEAAFVVLGESPETMGLCCKIAAEWGNSEEVKKMVKEYVKEQVVDSLPDESELLYELLKVARDKYAEPKAKVAALRTYAEIKGFLNKSKKQTSDKKEPGVMIVKEFDNWEERAKSQQGGLVNG